MVERTQAPRPGWAQLRLPPRKRNPSGEPPRVNNRIVLESIGDVVNDDANCCDQPCSPRDQSGGCDWGSINCGVHDKPKRTHATYVTVGLTL